VPSKEADEPAGASKTALITAATNNAPKTDTAKTEAKNVASKSVPNTAATKGAAENAATTDKKEAAKSAPNTAAVKNAAANAASGEKKVAANTKAEKKKMTENKKQPKQKGVAPAWTQANPHYKYGHPMLTAAQLESAGPATNALHRYYMKGCVAKQIDVVVQYKRHHFQRQDSNEYFLLCFNDLYDLFNLDGLDVSLLRIFTL